MSAERDLQRLADDVRKAVARARREAGLAMKEVAAEEARRVAGADLRLSGFKRGKGVVLSTGFDVAGDDVVLKAKPPGSWSIMEAGADPHPIRPRKRRRGRGQRPPVLRLPHGFAAGVDHPGMRGRRSWTRVRARIIKEVPEVVRASVAKALGG